VVESDSYAPVAVTTRSGFRESTHFGAVVVLDHDGGRGIGNPEVAVYPRSATKPVQALAMVRAGLDLPPDLLALVCASHSGLSQHLERVRRILARVGLDESALQNTPAAPLDTSEGRETSSLHQNCSGKHAGMLATCVVNGWPIETYLDPDHPLQQAITAELAEVSERSVVHVGVDGCGAPAHVTTLIGLATAFGNIATRPAAPERAVAQAMTTFPALLGGPGRDVTELIRQIPGLVAKDGAEGVYAAALPDGRAVAIKIADGASRARPAVMLAALASLGVDVSTAAPNLRQPILGHGREVGEVTISRELEEALRS
jgi:L-asparaginase II